MRGRLIFPCVATIARLDTDATAADPDAGGPLQSGYDPDFRSTVSVPDGSQAGASARKEMTPIQLRCQVEPETDLSLRQYAAGPSPRTNITLTFHFSDLEQAGLIGTDGTPAIRHGDRLTELRTIGGKLIQQYPAVPGAYCVELQTHIGLDGERNLLLCTFRDREVAA